MRWFRPVMLAVYAPMLTRGIVASFPHSDQADADSLRSRTQTSSSCDCRSRLAAPRQRGVAERLVQPLQRMSHPTQSGVRRVTDTCRDAEPVLGATVPEWAASTPSDESGPRRHAGQSARWPVPLKPRKESAPGCCALETAGQTAAIEMDRARRRAERTARSLS